jgi:hypothetical protein
LEIGDTTEKLKNTSGFSTNYDLSNHPKYGQIQTGARVPLKLGQPENCEKFPFGQFSNPPPSV